MANTFKFGNGNWAVKDGSALAYNDENNNFKPLPFDFTRASSATTLNRQGLIETVGSGKPRIDFTDNTSGHLLLEPSRTNIITNSEQFVDAPTGNTNMDLFSGTITNNNTTSPDGNTKGMKYTISSGSGATLRIYQSDLSTSADTTFTIYAKKGTTDSLSIDISGGTATTATLTDEWQRFSTTDTSNSNKFIDVTVTGSVGQYIYIFGMQTEAGSYPTSYIPTEGSSVTRVVENTANGGNSQTIGSSTGTVFLDLKDTNTIGGSANTDVMVIKNSSNIALGLYSLFIDSTGNIRLYNITGNTSVTLKSGDNRGQSLKIAFAYANADFVAYVNGVKTFESSSVSLQSGLDFISLNASPNEGLTIVNNVKLYDTRLTNTELQNLTS